MRTTVSAIPGTSQMNHWITWLIYSSVNGTVMQIKKALINDRLRHSEVSENFEFQLVIMLL